MFKRWARKAFDIFADFMKLNPTLREKVVKFIGDIVER